jgi:hypothetical protein
LQKIRVVILKNEAKNSHQHWQAACDTMLELIQYETIDITNNNWLKKINIFNPEIILTKPGGLTSPFKQLYDERLNILVKELNYFCFPSLDEVLIYENKRYFSYWLKAHQIPHPETNVYYLKKEANNYIKSIQYPIVAKFNIGASGSGVTILKNQLAARKYLENTFSGKGAKKRSGPNMKKGGLLQRGFHYIRHPKEILSKLSTYNLRAADIQNKFVIFQEYIPHDYEWRVVRMGDSFFAHKKLKTGEKASGTLQKRYENPPLELLDFVKNLTDRFGFYSQAIDLFETNNSFLVNEMQCIFGQSDPYQMLVNEVPGRYIQKENQWVFEAGDFNSNESYDLRLKTALELYERRNK